MLAVSQTGGGFGANLNHLSSEERERIYRRRRLAALGALAVVLLLVILLIGTCGGGGDSKTEAAKPPELPQGGRVILPRYKVVAYYGAPQDAELGVLGIGPPEEAGRKLLAQARRFVRPGQPVLPALELITTIAHAAPGQDGLHRERQTDAVIRRYLKAARAAKALLILDIQPGQADFMDEVEALAPYLSQPDVGIALDSEWHVPDGVVPGQQIGSTDATKVNEVSAYLDSIVRSRNLPEKLLLVHQFTDSMVQSREEVVDRPGVAIVSNIDGFGAPEVKVNIYKQLAHPATQVPGQSRLFNGIKLFFKEDTNLMSPGAVLQIRPQPSVVVYE